MNTTVWTVDIIDKSGTLCGFKLFSPRKRRRTLDGRK